MADLSKKLDVSLPKIEFILQQKQLQIRKNPEQSVISLNKELTLLAAEYGTRAEIPEHVMEEANRFVCEKFGHLGVKEIRAAYRAWASNELEIDNAEIYGGVFNVRQLGKVLEGWLVYRNRILAAYEKEKSKIELEKAEAEKAKRGKEEFEANFLIEIEKVKQRAKSWQDVQAYFYDAIQKRWPIKFELGEMDSIFKEAEQIAALEIETAKTAGLTNEQKRIEAMTMQKGKTEKAKTIAQKIAVFRKVISNS